MSLVLDASLTIAWAYQEENTAAILEVFAKLRDYSAWVPSLWKLEIANVLHLGVRKKRHDAAFRDAVLIQLNRMPILVDLETEDHAWSSTMRLADLYQLTTYDACYLELALRRNLPLATLDTNLRVAATREGVTLLGI
jgi:predicted nucleic acid-binding protein